MKPPPIDGIPSAYCVQGPVPQTAQGMHKSPADNGMKIFRISFLYNTLPWKSNLLWCNAGEKKLHLPRFYVQIRQSNVLKSTVKKTAVGIKSWFSLFSAGRKSGMKKN